VAPTLALCVPIFLLFLIGFEALGEYLLESSSSFLTIFFVGSYIVFSSYFVANHYSAGARARAWPKQALSDTASDD
jgi:hypothetical protein